MDTPGSGDCEAHLSGWGQPVLATTSAAYVVAGLVVLLWARRRSDVHWAEVWLYAGGLALAGLGSMDYHGPAWGPQPLLHDAGLALALIVAFGIDLRRLGVPVRPLTWALGGVTVALIAVIVVAPTLSPALAGVAALALVAAEALVYRRRLRPATPALAAGMACLLLGGVAYALSRTGGPLCQQESWLQGHGVWHVLTAAALALWAVTALPTSRSSDPAAVGG